MFIRFFRFYRHLAGWKKLFLGLVLGAFVGLFFGEQASFLKPFGQLFINAIYMMVTPVVSTAIICAIISLESNERIGKATLYAAIIYLLSMLVAASIGVACTRLIQPGIDFHPLFKSIQPVHGPTTVAAFIEHLIPPSPVAAFANENILQIIVFSVIFGISIRLTKDKSQPVADFFNSLSHVVFKLAGLIIGFAPYGIFALIASSFGQFGYHALYPLAQFISTVYLGCTLHALLYYGLFLALLCRYNPFIFFKHILSTALFAYTTASSIATLPLSMQCAEKKLGISHTLARFLLPLGANFNLNGLSIYLTSATLFAANMYGIVTGPAFYIKLVLAVVITAMGAAAVPGSALILMGAIMTTMGVPLGALALIAGVDRINDMMQTATNVTGDLFAALSVSKLTEPSDQDTQD